MADRAFWYTGQVVTQSEFRTSQEDLEQADRNVVLDLLGFGFNISGANLANVSEDSPQSLDVIVSQFIGYDQLGRRLSNLRSSFKNAVEIATSPPVTLDLSTDEVGSPTSVGSPGNEKTISIFVEFARKEKDFRAGPGIFFDQEEAIQFNVVQSAEALLTNSVPPPLRSDQILIADVTLVFGQTQIFNADIDLSRRQSFTFGLNHGTTHAGNGSDPVPDATTTVAGLFPAADKTKLDSIDFTATGIAALFDNRMAWVGQTDFTAPAATTADISGIMGGKSAGGSASKEAVVTQSGSPNNKVRLRNTSGDEFLDASGNPVYANITVNDEITPTVWTLSFFSLIAGSETAFDMTPFSGSTVRWSAIETFTQENLPTFDDDSLLRTNKPAGDIPTATTSVQGKVLAGANSPAIPLAGVVNIVQTGGSPIGGGPFHTLNFSAGAAAGPGPGVVTITTGSGPAGPTGPTGGSGPAGPTGPGFSTYLTPAIPSSTIAAEPSRGSSVNIPVGAVGTVRFFQVTTSYECLNATANDSVRIDSIAVSAGNITINYTTNSFGSGTNELNAVFFGSAAG